MSPILDRTDLALLDGWQQELPLVPRPFAKIGDALGLSEIEVLARFRRLSTEGAISRIGATCRPNTVSASTLGAMAVPEARIEEVAAAVGAEAGVNHVYLRENAWNIWFVATGPDRGHVDATLESIRRRTGLQVLDLPLVRQFCIGLGFALDGPDERPPPLATADTSVLMHGDRQIMQALLTGLPIVAQPFADIARELGIPARRVLDRIATLAAAGVLNRVGVIVRHRALGWRANAMIVWDLSATEVGLVGPVLATVPGVTLCYQRRSVSGVWPYTLYCMIHARTRAEAMSVLGRACEAGGLDGAPHQVLFSLRCFKQTGALVQTAREATA